MPILHNISTVLLRRRYKNFNFKNRNVSRDE